MRRFLATPYLMAVALAVALSLAGAASAQTIPTIKIIAVDADPSGNTATSLGPLNACVRSEPGEQVVVDLVVDAVPGPPEVNGMISFQVSIDYPPDILEVTNADYEFLLGARGTFAPLEFLVDSMPDRDGRFTVGVVDTAVNAPAHGDNVEEGPGVLARITLTAKTQGVATVAPAIDPSDADPGVFDAYPAVFGNENRPFQVETIAGALVAVGQDCPVPPDSTPAAEQVPPVDEELVAGGPTPTSAPADVTAEPTPSPATTGATEPTPTRGGPTQQPDGPGDTGNSITEGDGDDGIGAGTVALVAGLTLAGVGFAAVGGRMLLRQRARRNAASE